MTVYNRDNTTKRIQDAWSQTEGLQIRRAPLELDISATGLNEGFLVDGIHLYAGVSNFHQLIGTYPSTPNGLKKVLAFLHAWQRFATLAIDRHDGLKVAFHNHRLHAVLQQSNESPSELVTKANEVARELIATFYNAQSIVPELSTVRLAVGIEYGSALAVKNGTRGEREALFLGNPANVAAHQCDDHTIGVHLGPNAKKLIVGAGQSPLVLDPDRVTDLRSQWHSETQQSPLRNFGFPDTQRDLPTDLDELSPANSRLAPGCVVFADVDGFSSYISDAIRAATEGDFTHLALAARTLHVIRKELRDILCDARGHKIMYVGDCVIGFIPEGVSSSIPTADLGLLVAGAMQSAFEVMHRELPPTAMGDLKLAVGLGWGPVAITRLGLQRRRDRVIVGQAVTHAETAQRKCRGGQIALAAQYPVPEALKQQFEPTRIASGLDFTKIELIRRGAALAAGHAGSAGVPPTPTMKIPRAFASLEPRRRR